MSDVNKIVTIEQLKKAVQDYHGQFTKQKILDYTLTNEDIDAFHAKYFDKENNEIDNIRKSLEELEGENWLSEYFK